MKYSESSAVYLQTLYQDLSHLDTFLNGMDSLENNLKLLADFMTQYLDIFKLALIRTDGEQLKEYAVWSQDHSFTNHILEKFLSEHLNELLKLYREEKEIRDEAVVHMIQSTLDRNVLSCHPTVVPVVYAGKLLGLAFIGKPRSHPNWTKAEKELLYYLTPIISICYNNKQLHAEHALQNWVLNEIMDRMQINLYITNVETDEILFMNRTMKKTFHLEHPEGKICWKILQKNQEGRCEFCPIKALQTSTDDFPSIVWEEENTVTNRIYENYDSLMRWTDGSLAHFQQSIDITDSKRLSRAANYDELTEMYNRRAGKEALTKAIERARSEQVAITVCMYDANSLKEVNDTYGHAEGDLLLMAISTVVKSEMEPQDFPFRLSGDEFMIVFYNCSETRALKRMQKIESALAKQSASMNKPYQISFCYGLLEVSPDGSNLVPEILIQVDEKMYAQKRKYHQNRTILRQIENSLSERNNLIVSKLEQEKKKRQYDLALQNSYTEIYEYSFADDRLTPLLSGTGLLTTISYTGNMTTDIHTMMEEGVHPDDREKYAAFYQRDNLLPIVSSKKKELTEEYRRLGVDGNFYWVSSTVIPLPFEISEQGKCMILIKNITERKQIEIMHDELRRRYEMIFKQSYDAIIEVDLDADSYLHTAFTNRVPFPLPQNASYSENVEVLLREWVDAEDTPAARDILRLENLRQMYHSEKKELACQYRIKTASGLKWLENRIFFLHGNVPSVIISTKDVTDSKEKELKQHIAKQYDAALRGIYDELYELNVTQDSYQIVYHMENKYVTPPERGNLTHGIALVADNMIYPEDKSRFLKFFDLDAVRAYFATGKDSMLAEFRKLCVDGKYHWASLTLFPVEAIRHGDEIYLCFIMDINDKKHADEIEEQNRLLLKQQSDDERYRIVVEQTDTIVYEWNRNTGTFFLPTEMREMFQANYDGRNLYEVWTDDDIVHPDDAGKLLAFLRTLNEKVPKSDVLLRLKKYAKEYVWCRLTLSNILDESGDIKRVIGTINDVNEAVKSENALKYRAEFDLLTGIYNTQAFYVHASQNLKRYPTEKYAIIRMDINRFKFINDLYGMEEGDKLLRFIAEILRKNVSEKDIYGRIGGDVFCICASYQKEEELTEFTCQLRSALSEYVLGCEVVPYFGICIIDDRTVPVSILCDWANLALKTVKGNNLKSYAFYDDQLRAKQLDERNIENQMEQALSAGQFTIFLQPKHDIRTSRIVGAEALARWLHPKEGLITPDRFIPLFEHNGFILRLDEYIWEQVCILLRKWIDNGYAPVPLSVNVSRLHLYNADLCEILRRLAQKYDLPRELLELELTESTFVEYPDELYRMMGQLQKDGFRFSIDDFGSGYSSLNMLKNTRADIIKLDRGFLSETTATPKGKTVIQNTINMVKQLDLDVVTEGVETKKQADFLLHSGCNTAQGFYFSMPMPVEQFETLAFPGKSRRCK